MTERSSPPPLDELWSALAGKGAEVGKAGPEEDGWWLGREGGQEGRTWIGEEERRLMRLWAGVVCRAIDGKEGEDAGWGEGALGWEI